jgi:hypothetical protein
VPPEHPVPGGTGGTGGTGSTGAAGTRGDIGAVGNEGATGLDGERGQAGLPGAPGGTGVHGGRGIAGDTGEAGDVGLIGQPGPTGATGATGSQGPPGDIGPEGEQGPPGMQGAPGTTVYGLGDGFQVDLLPTTSARGSVAAAATVVTTVPLTSGYWHSITYEYTGKRSTGVYYVYRTQIEAYRPLAGNATLHLVPTLTPTEYPLDQGQTVVITVSGANVVFTLTNGSADSFTYAIYAGSISKPLP